MQFDDNRLLSLLYGEHDRHLARIEQALDVGLVPRGNVIAITGPEDARVTARETLEKLYRRLNQGQEVGLAEVDAAIRMSDEIPEADRTDEDEALVIATRRRHITPRSKNQSTYLRAILDHDLVFGIGPAGTGKTYLAVASAVHALERDRVRRIVLTRPAVEAGEKLGFLPGDLSQKVDPYLRPLYDALYEMLGFERVARLIDKQVIEIAPLAFMRGRTLNESYVILDEAQNTTREQMKMFLTRIGFSSVAVVTGDVTQIDLPRNMESGLRHALRVLEGVPGIGMTFFGRADVVRHPLVQAIVQAYEAHEEEGDDRGASPDS
ncbi:MAG: PhoH family protein [Algiphilus sp.]